MTRQEIDLIRSGTLEGFILFYNAISAEQGFTFEPHLTPTARALLDPRIRNLMYIAGPGTGKSFLFSVIYPAYLLGMNPKETILGVSAGEALIQGFMSSVMSIIEYSPFYREVFPDTRPDKDRGWSTERGLFVTGHEQASPDASYWGAGISSKALTGKHATTIILDDLHDEENSNSLDQIEKVVRAFNMTIMGRSDPRGARFIVAGRRWHVNDLYGKLMERGDYTILTLPAERPGQTLLYYDLQVAEGEENVFTENNEMTKVFYGVDPKKQGFFWPRSEQKRRDYFILKKTSPAVAKAVYLCKPVSSLDQVFSEEYLLYYIALETLVLGGSHPANKDFMSQFEHVLQSWDTAATKKERQSDWSVGLTAGLKPCNQWHRGEDESVLGPCDNHYDIYLLDETRVQLEPVKLLESVRIAQMKWRADLPVLIEKKSSGEMILSILGDSGVHVEPVLPGRHNKLQRATMTGGNFSVQGWFQLGRIYLPENLMWVEDFVKELVDFDGSEGGQDDRVDALIYLVRKVIELSQYVTYITDSNAPTYDPVKPQPKTSLDEITENVYNPFEESCAYCLFYKKQRCDMTKRPTSPIHSCEFFQPKDQENSSYIMDCTINERPS